MKVTSQAIVKTIPLSRSPGLQDWVCFAQKIASFLNRKAEIVPANREMKISPLPMQYKGKRDFTLSFEFKSHGSGVSYEQLLAPNALARALNRRGIREITFVTGVSEKRILAFISQAQSRDSTISSTTDIRVYFNTGSLERPPSEDQ
jgi:hypothetical protein